MKSETMNIYNISSLINAQLITLIQLVKDKTLEENCELDVDIYLQIYSLKKIEDKRREKKFYSLCLNDNLYRYGRFILMENELSNQLQNGYIINIKKIISKRVSSGLYIMIKDFAIIDHEYNNILGHVKLITENEEELFVDEDGNNIEKLWKNSNNNFDKSIKKEINEVKNKYLILDFDNISYLFLLIFLI